MSQKSIKKNFALSLTNTLAGLLYPIVTFPYISRILQPEGVGLIQFYQSVVSYFALFAALGIPLYAVKEISKRKDDVELRNKTTAEIVYLFSTLTAIAYIVLIIVGFVIPELSSHLGIFLILSLHLILVAIGCEWFYQAVEEFKYITVRSLIVKFLSLIALFVFVRNENDLYAYAILLVLGEAGNYLLNFVHLRKYVKIFAYQFKWDDIKRHIKPAFEIFLLNVIVSIYINLDSVMLGFIKGEEAVGYYTAATKITKAFTGITSALGFVVFPRLTNYYAKGEIEQFKSLVTTSLNFIIILYVPIAVGLVICAPTLIPLYCGAMYLPSILTLQIMTPIVVFISISGILGTITLYAMDLQRLVIICTALGALSNFVLNLILIPLYSHQGAAIASVVAEMSVAISMLCFSNKHIGVTVFNKNSIDVFVGAIFIAVVLIVFNARVNISPLLLLLADLTLATIVYVMTMLLMQNKDLKYGFVEIKKIIRNDKDEK